MNSYLHYSSFTTNTSTWSDMRKSWVLSVTVKSAMSSGSCLVDGISSTEARRATHQILHLPCRYAKEALAIWVSDWLKGRGVLAHYWSVPWHRVKNKLAARWCVTLPDGVWDKGWSLVYLHRLTVKWDDMITKLPWACRVPQRKRKHRAGNDCCCPREGALPHKCF